MIVTYFSNAQGYAIKAVTADGDEALIVCGNHVGESAGFVPPGHPQALSPATIRRYCMETLASEYPGIKARYEPGLCLDIARTREALR